MNEASSKYVDQIAVEKLLNEKLRRVHHAPDGLPVDSDPFAGLSWLTPAPNELQATTVRVRTGLATELGFPSPLASGYEENDVVRCRCLLANGPSASLILVHGLFEDILEIYNSLLSLLNEQGCNIY
jgi:hypothetical protein